MMNFFKKKWYVVVIILVIIGLVYFKIGSNAKGAKNGKKQTSYVVKRQNLKETLSLSGSIDAEEKATLRFQSSGRLSWVGVKEGDYVRINISPRELANEADIDVRVVKDLMNRLSEAGIITFEEKAIKIEGINKLRFFDFLAVKKESGKI